MELATLLPSQKTPALAPEGFRISREKQQNRTLWILEGGTPATELYAVFHVLEQIAEQHPLAPVAETPSSPIRWVKHWDNLNGTIERGYAGAQHLLRQRPYTA